MCSFIPKDFLHSSVLLISYELSVDFCACKFFTGKNLSEGYDESRPKMYTPK
jgi:hypothetical protein